MAVKKNTGAGADELGSCTDTDTDSVEGAKADRITLAKEMLEFCNKTSTDELCEVFIAVMLVKGWNVNAKLTRRKNK